MRVVVNLDDVVEAMEIPEEWASFLDPDTGEIFTVSDDEGLALEEAESGSETPQAPNLERDSLARLGRLLDSGRALALPDSFDIHEWDLMRRFAQSVEDADARDELADVIRGSGAFRRFKESVARLGLRDRWFNYRDEALRNIARDWLEANGIEYVERSSAS